MKQKTKDKGTFHRLLYNELLDLKDKFNTESPTCGYMRNPYYNSTTNEIRGSCYFMKDEGIESKCTRRLPFKAEGCEYYDRWNRKFEASNVQVANGDEK